MPLMSLTSNVRKSRTNTPASEKTHYFLQEKGVDARAIRILLNVPNIPDSAVGQEILSRFVTPAFEKSAVEAAYNIAVVHIAAEDPAYAAKNADKVNAAREYLDNLAAKK